MLLFPDIEELIKEVAKQNQQIENTEKDLNTELKLVFFHDPWGSGLGHVPTAPCYSYKATECDRKNRGPVSPQMWHDKDASLLKGHKRRAKD